MSNSGFNRPQKRRNLRRGLIAAFVVLSIVMLIADRQRDSMLASGRLTPDDASAKVMGVLAIPIRGIEAMFGSVKDRTRAFEENKTLKAEVERLKVIEYEASDLRLRLDVFADLLGVSTSSEIPETRVLARAVSEKNGPFVHSALINAGRNKAINVGYAVATIDGLYGHVVRAGNNSARVLLLNDLSSHISVMSQRSQSRAIMIGNNDDTPRLSFIPPESDWRVGDVIVTSGDGGVLPRGLRIGKVININEKTLGVDLDTKGKSIDWVFVFPFEPIPDPDETAQDETQTDTGSEDDDPPQIGPPSGAEQ